MYQPVQFNDLSKIDKRLSYKEFGPTPFLSQFISCFWVLTSNSNSGMSVHRVLPDACVDLIFDFQSKFLFASWFSETTEYLQIEGKAEFCGVRILPHGIPCILRGNTAFDKNASLGIDGSFMELQREIEDAVDIQSVLLKMSEYLSHKFKEFVLGSKMGNIINQAIDSKGKVTVKDISSNNGISERQLYRYFNDNIGTSTKSFLRIIRFQNAYKLIGKYNFTSSEISLRTGFYDQSHFLKEMDFYLGGSKELF